MARQPVWKHAYSVTSCPDCGWDLTKYGGVRIYGATDSGRSLGEHITSLDSEGVLQDVDRIIESGFHSDTFCGRCGESLAEYEEEQIG